MQISNSPASHICAIMVGALVAIGGVSVALSATPPQPERIRATIQGITGDVLQVVSRGGIQATVRLAPDAALFGITQGTISDVKPDSFVGSAAIPQSDGTLRALEVTVFPPGIKSGEGNYPWDLGRNSQMTNGTVGSVVGTRGSTMTVKYGSSEKKIVIPPDVPVVQLAPGDRSLLVPGAHVVLFVTKGADGSTIVQRALVGRNGLVPPM